MVANFKTLCFVHRDLFSLAHLSITFDHGSLANVGHILFNTSGGNDLMENKVTQWRKKTVLDALLHTVLVVCS